MSHRKKKKNTQKSGSEKQTTAGNGKNLCCHLTEQLLLQVWTLYWCMTSSEVSVWPEAVMFTPWVGMCYLANHGIQDT